jgi:hypothetical protein
VKPFQAYSVHRRTALTFVRTCERLEFWFYWNLVQRKQVVKSLYDLACMLRAVIAFFLPLSTSLGQYSEAGWPMDLFAWSALHKYLALRVAVSWQGG